MHLLITLCLCLCLLPFLISASTNHTITLNFDTLPTSPSFGLSPLPSPYHHLAFSPSFAVFNPRSPAFRNIITPNDYNCAVSSPNALLGSGILSASGGDKRERGAWFGIANATAMKEEEGLEPYFSLRSFYVKPMDFPDDAGVRVRVRGYLHDKSEGTLDWHVDFPAGYHLPFLVKMEEYSRGRWEGLRWVEVSAGFGEEELDWEVCLDDLVVGFEEVEEAGGKGKAMEQVVLGEG